jgi:amidase
VKTLTELRNFNRANVRQNAIKYGQTLLDASDALELLRDRPQYEIDRARDIYLTETHGITEIMDVLKLDALLFPGSTGADIAARLRRNRYCGRASSSEDPPIRARGKDVRSTGATALPP